MHESCISTQLLSHKTSMDFYDQYLMFVYHKILKKEHETFYSILVAYLLKNEYNK